MNKKVEIIEELKNYFEERADAEYFTDNTGPIPNEEMKMLALVEELDWYIKKNKE